MKTQPENHARRMTGAVESSGTQAGRAVARTTARAGQRGDPVSGSEAEVATIEDATMLPLFPDIAERRDFPLELHEGGMLRNAVLSRTGY